MPSTYMLLMTNTESLNEIWWKNFQYELNEVKYTYLT